MGVHAHDRASRWIGKVLQDKWTIDAKIAHGGVATVFRATHRQGQVAAIKIMHPEYARNEDVRRRFLREGYAANKVNHRGVVRVLDDDVTPDGSAYIVMELLSQGEVLEDRRERLGGRLPVSDVADIGDQVLDVLAAAHENGIIHRDIKPENIFVLTDGTVKVLDFGIAHIKEAAQKENTATGLLLGTPEYMSPEQALGTRGTIDAQTDIYALGATMFTLLSGEAVHVHDALQALLVAAASRQARSLSSVAFKEIPRELIAVVDRALALEKPRRWPSARAMQLALREAVPGSARMLARRESEGKAEKSTEPPRPIEEEKKPAKAKATTSPQKGSLPPLAPPSRSQSGWPAPRGGALAPGALPKPTVAKRHSAVPPAPAPAKPAVADPVPAKPPKVEPVPASFPTEVSVAGPKPPRSRPSDAPSSGPTAVIEVRTAKPPRTRELPVVDDTDTNELENAVDSADVPTQAGLKAAPRVATKSDPWTEALAPDDGPTVSLTSGPEAPIARPPLPSLHPDGELTSPLLPHHVERQLDTQSVPATRRTSFAPPAPQRPQPVNVTQSIAAYGAPPPAQEHRASYVPPPPQPPQRLEWQTPRTGFPPPMQPQQSPKTTPPSPLMIAAMVAAAIFIFGLWLGSCLLVRGF